MARPLLPIDPLLPEIVDTLRRSGCLVLEAPPGAGKTTRVPRALLEAGVVGDREIIVLQPRRLPTRLASRRVAEELGEPLGERVGYQVRFEDVSGPRTRLRFVTEGVLGRRLLSDPTLRGVGAVVLDEFHERHLAGDVSLALLRRLQQTTRPDLKLVVMSATLEAEPVAAYLGGAPRLRSEGRRFDVELEHLAAADDRHLDQQVVAALKRLIQRGIDGHVLVFLPGAGEIRRTRDAAEELASRHGFELLPLHGDLPPAEQDRAVRASNKTKIILSTNVAETSVTIEGVATVIDTGVARQASHSPWSGMPVLKLAKISKASAIQRAGRAGRTRSGVCLRLYTQHDFAGRPDHDVPEIRRLDLAETLLSLRASGVRDVARFPFFEPPPAASIDAADGLLRRLGAVDAAGAVTGLGHRMLRYPVHPRQARVLLEGEKRGVGREASVVAALLGERDIRREARAQLDRGQQKSGGLCGPSDLLELLERFEEARRSEFAHGRLNAMGLDAGAVQAVDRVQKQLGRGLERGRPALTGAARDQALQLAILTGYPDRVARRRRAKSQEVVFSGGGSGTLAETSVVREAELMVAVDAEERGTGKGVIVRLASGIEPESLLELYPEALRDVDRLEWNASAGRVERVTQLLYEGLTLEETRAPAPSSLEAGRVLAEAALAQGVERLPDAERIAGFRARVDLLRSGFPEAGLPAIDEAFIREAVATVASTLRSLEELREASVADALAGALSAEHARLLTTALPERVTLPGGRQIKVNYEPGKPPWIESRLQDFFGMAQGPALGKGRIPLVMHLLAPNQRAVQVTTDLPGFWDRHYPAIRKELMRKYPRHAWPEDPLHAQPPAPHVRKR